MAAEKTGEAYKIQILQKQLQFTEKLKFVTNRIHAANNVNEILFQLKNDILCLFDAEGVTIYLIDPVKRQLVSKYLVGPAIKEILLPISHASIAGPRFTKVDEKSIEEMVRVLGIAFRNQSKMLHTRFDYLISHNIITDEELKAATALAREQKKDIETVLMENYS